MLLLHGDACVESGFSVDEGMLVESMSEDWVVARRMVFDSVTNKGGISTGDVNRKMLKFVNNTHSEYVKQLEKQKEQQTSGEKKKSRKITNELKTVKELKRVKEAKQKFTEQHKEKIAKLGS